MSIMGTSLPDTEALSWGANYRAVIPCSLDMPPDFYPLYMGVRLAHFTFPTLLPISVQFIL